LCGVFGRKTLVNVQNRLKFEFKFFLCEIGWLPEEK
jgi:hypothetical protein